MSKAIALLGDWNATPHDRGRWSPSWLAGRAGLTIRSAGPGRHGDIDYPMADCRLSSLERHAPPSDGGSRSDHDVVTFVATHGRKSLVVGTWNLLYGRDAADVRVQVDWVLRVYGLDVLVCQEAADYHRQLGSLPGYRLVAFDGYGKEHNVILVRDGLLVRGTRLVRTSPLGWRLVPKGTHAPLYSPSCVVEWLRVVAVHMPPTVNWTKRGVIFGPPMRVAAYVAASRTLMRWARANRRSRD